ncbi:MAG: hypothetical protein CMN11_16545 [Roseobacter sp.]|nr:hypothetical protein [Roseobacter sp.]
MILLKSSQLVRNVTAVATGTAAAQVIVVAFSPLITRIYGPEAFGLQGVFLSLVAILSPVITMRYPMAIITAENEDEALQLSTLSLLIAGCFAVTLWIIIIAGGEPLLQLLGIQDIGTLILFLPIALLSVAYEDVMSFQAARLNAFKLIGKVEVFRALFSNLARLLGGIVAPIAAVLVVVASVAPAFKAVMLRKGTAKLHQSSLYPFRTGGVKLLKRHQDFAVYRMPTDLLNALAQSVPVLLLAALFSPAIAGLYTLAFSVINLPLNILGLAIGNVLYARFAELQRERKPLLILTLKATLFQLLVPGLGVGLFSLVFPDLFVLIFGPEWRVSGEFAQWMTLWIICMLVNIPSVRALPVIRQQKWHLLFNALIFLGGVIGIYLGYQIEATAIGSVIYFSVVSMVLYIGQIFTYLMLINNHDRKLPCND